MLDEDSVGLGVETVDHHALGVVAAVGDERLQLAPRSGRPFWIDGALVRAIEGDHVTLHLDRKALKRYRPSIHSTERLVTAGAHLPPGAWRTTSVVAGAVLAIALMAAVL